MSKQTPHNKKWALVGIGVVVGIMFFLFIIILTPKVDDGIISDPLDESEHPVANQTIEYKLLTTVIDYIWIIPALVIITTVFRAFRRIT